MNQEPGTTMLGEHKVATANGCCTLDCPACLDHDRYIKMMGWGFFVLMVGAALFKVFACRCGS